MDNVKYVRYEKDSRTTEYFFKINERLADFVRKNTNYSPRELRRYLSEDNLFKYIVGSSGETPEMQAAFTETVEKITNPGLKEVYRIYNSEGRAIADLLAMKGEEVDLSESFRFVDPRKPWKVRSFENCTAKKMQKQVISNGKRTEPEKSAKDIAVYVKEQLANEIWEEEQRFENPHFHYIDMTPAYYEMKMDILARDDRN